MGKRKAQQNAIQLNTAVKIALYAAGLGAIVYAVRMASSNLGKQISIAFKGIGIPVVRSGKLTLPVTLHIKNLTPLSVPIDNVKAAIFILRENLWQFVGETENTGALTINTGETPVTVYPTINLTALIPQTTVINVLNVLANNNPLVTVKIATKVTVQGYGLEHTIEQKISLDQLYKNAA